MRDGDPGGVTPDPSRGRAGVGAEPERPHPHLQCPFCGAYTVQRLFVPAVQVDSCSCDACGASWDEERETGKVVGRGEDGSVLLPRGRATSDR